MAMPYPRAREYATAHNIERRFMKFVTICLFWIASFATVVPGTAAEPSAVDTNSVFAWMTNTFRPWLTRYYPEVNSKFYPEWVHDHPGGLVPGPFTNWLGNAFPDLETEMFPTWMDNFSPEVVGTNIPAWWGVMLKGKYSVSPAAQPLPTIIRGPYLQLGTTNSMVVRWRTDLPSSSSVSYGTSLSRLNRTARSSGTFEEHAVQFTNLAPATKYYYALGPTDTPLTVRMTNDIAFISSTNSRIYVNKPVTREQIAVANRDTFVLVRNKKRWIVTDLEKSFTANTTNASLVVNTPNNAVLVTITNNAIAVTTSNQVVWLDPGPPPLKSRRPAPRNFLVGTTNLIRTGGDSNTFFVTHPPVGQAKPTRIWVLGDPGTRKKAERDVRDAYYKWNGDRTTDLWLMLGDNAYTSGKDSEYQGAIFQMFDAMLRKSVLWPSLGNHDAGSANSPIQFGVYYDIFSLPSQGQAGGVMSGTEAYYSFDYANIHIVCIDSSDSDWSRSGLMLRWLKEDLEANKQDWLIAYCHHPPYTRGSHNSDNDRDSEGRMRMMRERVLPILEENGLDLMLGGHSHAYERSYLMDGFYGRSTNINEKVHVKSKKDGRQNGTGVYVKPTLGPAPHEGAIYIVAGSSGQTSGGQLKHPVNFISLNVLGSLVLDIDGPRLDATFIDDKAKVRDHFSIVKGEEPSVSPPKQ
jgi:hypothetical protein